MSDPTRDDCYRAMELVERMSPQTHDVAVVVVEGDPPSKARPRFTKHGGVYTPKKTVAGEQRYASAMDGLPTLRGNVAVGCVFYRASHQRIDVDNLVKAVLDAGTKAAMWIDDSQVTALSAVVEYDRENPRAIVAFGHHDSSLKRGEDAMVECEACHKPFYPAGHQRRGTARWCSRECRTVLAAPITCGECGQPFKRRTGNQRLCSEECRRAAQASRNRSTDGADLI